MDAHHDNSNSTPASDSATQDLTAKKLEREIQKLDLDLRNASLERWKGWAAIFAPVVTALTIFGAVFAVWLQIGAKTDSDEDTFWRDTVKAIAETKTADQKEAYLRTLLKPFLTSKRYRDYARGLSLQELVNIKDLAAFDDIFGLVFARPTANDFSNLTFIARGLTEQTRNYFAAKDDPVKGADNKRILEIVYAQLRSTCTPLETVLKNNNAAIRQVSRQGAINAGKLDLASIYFEGCDFSVIDLSGAELTGSVFNRVKLNGSNLTGIVTDPDTPRDLWAGVIWWRAKMIDGPLLLMLISDFEPNHFFGQGYADTYANNEVIDKGEYERNVARLCAAAKVQCPSKLPFRHVP